MGNNRKNRFNSAEECTIYLKSIGINTIICLEYGGKFKARSIFKCLICNHIWETTLDCLCNRCASGCPNCARLVKIGGIEEVNQWLKENNIPIICLYYAGSSGNKKSKFKCLIDGYEWTSSFANIKNCNKGCAKCANVKKIKDVKEVNDWLKENQRDIICLQYAGNIREKSIFQCLIDGNVWRSTFNNIKNGNGCPKCKQSRGEKLVENILRKHNITYTTQKWFDDCRDVNPLPFDFYVLHNEKMGLIEFQGIQHYQPVDFANKGEEWATKQFLYLKSHDEIKENYCINNNIPLLQIKYDDTDIENAILNFFDEYLVEQSSLSDL